MGGCYTGRNADGNMDARRRLFDEVREPVYPMSKVPLARKYLEGSVLLKPPSRESWWCCLTEMLLLCNEAANRQASKNMTGKKKDNADGVQSKPLGLEYIADRLDTDDPIFGYMVRSEKEGWLQGFLTMTTFTTWHDDFIWNSLVREAGISDDDKRVHKWDFDGSLAKALQECERKGDANNEGIVWNRVAEVSLLGACGCGGQLLRLMIEELEAGDDYDFVVLQATDNAIGFYENLGFVRVGAIARPALELMAQQAAEAQARAERRAKENEAKRAARREEKEREDVRPDLQAQQGEGLKWRDVCRRVV
eukprot:CAMPEP_0173446566 /NCGR_PEP_ID=MMETSP1357-20121228/36863_1 /TAXON_ID=77926 /ORGANISM="Hemiselmis rufescens, Strain PCC563" /LENGTH=307 /DNA_ID=CAMNT_0014412869 /DNA_START=84 /DNA_END=1004 /DNA_ORIENTATION=-